MTIAQEEITHHQSAKIIAKYIKLKQNGTYKKGITYRGLLALTLGGRLAIHNWHMCRPSMLCITSLEHLP